MKVKDFIQHLKMSAIRGLAIASSSKNQEEHELQLLSYINRALVKIYGDLNLSQGYVKCEVKSDKLKFEMPDDYMNILAVVDERGVDLHINNENEQYSVFTPEPGVVQIDEAFIGQSLFVVYLKAPALIGSIEDKFPLPRQYMEAMIFYCAYIANELIHGVPNWEHQSFLNKYNDEIMRLKTNGLTGNIHITNTKLIDQGYV